MILFFCLCFSQSAPSYELVGSTLTISGDGSITAAGVNSKPVSLVVEVIINEGITTIASNSFSKCENMRKVSFPDSLVRMEGCFSNTELEEITIPINLKEITVPHIWTFTPLGKITVNSSNQYFSSYGNCLLNKDQTHLYAFVNTPDFEFPSTLKSIGTWAFAYKGNLVFKIPDSVTSMAYQSFVDTDDCTVVFTENSLLEEIPERFFHQSAKCSFVVPPKVTKINTEAFYNSKITSVSFYPESQLRVISDKAFNICGDLKTINLPKSVRSISQSAFEGCANLESITVEDGCEYLEDNGVCIFAPSERKIVWVHHNTSEFTVEAWVEVICATVLQTCANLTRIELDPLNDKFSIHDNVIYTPFHRETYSVIGGIESCEIHSNCTKITKSFFARLTKLRRVTFAANSSCRLIDEYAFYSSSLESIELADSITDLGVCALRGTKLTSVKLPPRLNNMAAYQFINSNELTEVVFDWDCPLNTITSYSFTQCFSLTKVVLSKNIQYIQDLAFCQCNFTVIEIPPLVSSIAEEAFGDNYYLREVKFEGGSNLDSIGISAFRSAAVESIILPKKLVTLSNSAFANCTRLKNVTFEDESLVTHLVAQTFMGCVSLETFLVPKGITDLDPTSFYKCTKLTKFEVDNSNEKYESIDGVVYSKEPKSLALFPPGKEMAVIADGTVNISDNAFYGCSILSSLDFGTSEIESIGELTFFECTGLSSLVVPKTVVRIFARAFEGCVSMTSIEFVKESKLRSIGSSTFLGCGNLTAVKFPPDSLLERIEDSTFEDCVLLSDFAFPSNVSSIGASAFKNCKSLRTVILNETKVSEISDEAFRGCQKLATLVLPSRPHSIGNMAFEGAPIKELHVPSDVEALGFGCFSQCKSLKKVYYCGDAKFDNNLIFSGSSDIIAYTLRSYPHSSFCGLPTLKVMKRCGVFPTVEFTSNLAEAKVPGGLCAAIALSESDEDESGQAQKGLSLVGAYSGEQRNPAASQRAL